jgi:hypothetical protein
MGSDSQGFHDGMYKPIDCRRLTRYEKEIRTCIRHHQIQATIFRGPKIRPYTNYSLSFSPGVCVTAC